MLDRHRDTARPLAGGQSLVPMMNMRLARPGQLVDLNGLSELSYLKVDGGELRIGAMTRQRELERSALVRDGWPMLAESARHIGHIQIRNRGTVGGSLAHAYPCAELPMAMLALDASFVLRGERHERIVNARNFFLDAMSTVLDPGELLVEIRVPEARPRSGGAFHEISRRHGDFALAAAAAAVALRSDGTVDDAAVVLAGAKPHLCARTDMLIGEKPEAALFAEAADAASGELDFESDIHASAAYRKEVSKVLARRALAQAAARASGDAK